MNVPYEMTVHHLLQSSSFFHQEYCFSYISPLLHS